MLALLSLSSGLVTPAAPLVTQSFAPLQQRAAPVLASAEPGRRQALAVLGGSAAALVGLPAATWAESTSVTRQQAYSRYVPRIERGRDYWATGLKKAILAGDWATIQADLEPKGSIDRIFGPMGLWSSSMSGKTISEKTYNMNAAIDDLREACRILKSAADGQEAGGGGFFGFGGGKKIEGKVRTAMAVDAYKKGVRAINKYIEIGNAGQGLQARPAPAPRRPPARALPRDPALSPTRLLQTPTRASFPFGSMRRLTSSIKRGRAAASRALAGEAEEY